MGSVTQRYVVYDFSGMAFGEVRGAGTSFSSERLRGGFALRFRLACLPESGLTLLELPGTLRLFTHEVTVRETETGFVYVSNSVLSGGEGTPPANILVGERKSQISMLG